MKTETKNVAHLYIGNPIIIHDYVKKYSEYGWLTNMPLNFTIYKLHEFNEDCFYGYKLLLRPLNKATREEINMLIWYIMNNNYIDKADEISKEEASGSFDDISIDDKFMPYSSRPSFMNHSQIYHSAIVVDFTVRCFIGKIYLTNSGLIHLFNEDDNERPIEFNPYLYSYLLTQGFDLFNLIPSGQAIDKTTLQTT